MSITVKNLTKKTESLAFVQANPLESGSYWTDIEGEIRLSPKHCDLHDVILIEGALFKIIDKGFADDADWMYARPINALDAVEIFHEQTNAQNC